MTLILASPKSQSTFITNSENELLKERISELINFSKVLKFLIGFFYFSGSREPYEVIKSNPDITVRVHYVLHQAENEIGGLKWP